MELTLDQALQKGVEAHKAGKVQEADRYYTAILKANPKHADANHNMGVLAVGVSKVQGALPFFKTALEVNPNVAQYWLSYIDALIKLDRITDAKAVLEKAKNKGATGDGFDKLEVKLGLSGSKTFNDQEPPKEQLDSLMKLYNQNRSQQVFDKAQKLTKRFTKSLNLWNILGASAVQIGQPEQAVFAFQKALSIKPDYAEAYNNMGIALKEQGKLEDAVETYSKALSINPDYAEAYNNMGNALQEQGKHEEAIDAYNKALAIKPDYAEASNNMALSLYQIKKYKEAASLFRKNKTIKSQTWLLKCLYELNNKSHFFDQLDFLISNGENNAIIGSYTSRSKIRYGIYRENPFCDEPLKYVQKIDLLKSCDFQEVFVKGAVKILNEGIVQKKRQSLVVNGNQTAGNVFGQMGQHREKIQDLISRELEKYRLKYKDSSAGLISNWPTNYRLKGWIVKYKNGGAIKPHMHEEGWISGSVYINVPPKLKDDSGNLVVCIGSETDQGTNSKSINVVTGSLCLFPSSLLHYTIPFESNEDRIVLAFDMVPNK